MSGYRSRSAYKLIEIIKKFSLLNNKKDHVLDLGSSPGGWSQVLTEKLVNGKVISVDLKPMDKIKNNIFIQGDFTDSECQKKFYQFLTEESKEFFLTWQAIPQEIKT